MNILTLRNRYPIANAFLNTSLDQSIFPERETEIVGPAASVGEPVHWQGEVVFKVTHPVVERRDSSWSFAALLLGLSFLALTLHRLRKAVEALYGIEAALGVILLSLFGIRLAMVKAGIPSLFLRTDLFDPRMFASSELSASMGDLVLNGLCVFILVVYLLRHYSGLRLVRWLLGQSPAVRLPAGVFLLFMALLAVLLSFNFIEVVYHNSTQTLDITQSLDVAWVRVAAFAAVLLGTLSAFIFVHVMASLSKNVLSGDVQFFVGLALAGLLFVAQTTASGNYNLLSMGTGVLMLASMRLFRFDRLELSFSFRVVLYLVFSLSLYSIHHSLAIRAFHQERLVGDQFRYAKDFLTERDILGENLIDLVRHRIAADPFIQTRMASPFFSKDPVIDKVRRVHLNRYFDRYELSITTRKTGDSLFLFDPIRRGYKSTGAEGIWFSAATAGSALRKYHVTVPVYSQRPIGTVEIDLVMRRVLPENVFPELLVDNRFSQLYRNRDFSFAIFREGRLVSHSGAFTYEANFDSQWLTNKELYQDGITDPGGSYHHVGIEELDGSVAVVSAPSYEVASVITNICFWFVLVLTVLLTAQGLYGAITLLSGQQVGYAARIQLFMFLAFALPMAAVSVTTLTLMGRANEESTTREFLDRSGTSADRLATLMSQDPAFDRTRLESWVVDNAVYADADISVFSPAGSLIVTSQPDLYESQLISRRINREAYAHIIVNKERQAVTSERIGSLLFSSAYAAVVSPRTGLVEAIIGMPFFESLATLQQDQLLVFSNILRVFVLVFLVFTFLSFLAADSLTFPIRFITRTLRQTTFGAENRPIFWENKDEIGLLVSEYNRMVSNLEESRRALARSEKESAWREMAKQVAHEIKNPLTPMKLTLQQMEKSLSEGGMDAGKTRKSVDVLLRQVEILNAIASSFSMFAQMPVPTSQRIDLATLTSDVVSLFGSGEGKVNFSPPAGKIEVLADPAAVSRALSNLLINAFQAGVEGREIRVEVILDRQEGKARLIVRDNGTGIPVANRERIFQPQFTTKESGSGLGLYMARQFVVQAGGSISFETQEGIGTEFFIELPLAKN